jgi:hypothetical protein
VAKVDCTSEGGKPLCQRFDIRGYPSVLYFPKDEELTGKYIKHQGPRNLEGFENFGLKEGYL